MMASHGKPFKVFDKELISLRDNFANHKIQLQDLFCFMESECNILLDSVRNVNIFENNELFDQLTNIQRSIFVVRGLSDKAAEQLLTTLSYVLLENKAEEYLCPHHLEIHLSNVRIAQLKKSACEVYYLMSNLPWVLNELTNFDKIISEYKILFGGIGLRVVDQSECFTTTISLCVLHCADTWMTLFSHLTRAHVLDEFDLLQEDGKIQTKFKRPDQPTYTKPEGESTENVELASHHVIPLHTLKSFVERIVSNVDRSLFQYLTHMCGNLKKRLETELNTEEFQEFGDDGKKIARRHSRYFTIFSWLPGNIMRGPMKRADDPDKKFEKKAIHIIGKENYDLLEGMFKILIYIEKKESQIADKRTSEEKKIKFRDEVNMVYMQTLYAINAMCDILPVTFRWDKSKWIEDMNGKWRIDGESSEIDLSSNSPKLLLENMWKVISAHSSYEEKISRKTREAMESFSKKSKELGTGFCKNTAPKRPSNAPFQLNFPNVNSQNWNKFQIMIENVSGPAGNSFFQFDIIENDANGNCLFSSVLEFLRIQEYAPNTVQELRSMTVNHVLRSDTETGLCNFDLFKESLLINLRGEIPSFSSNSASDKTLKEDYAGYMSSAFKFGTTTELCAMAAIFNFGFYVIRKIDRNDYTIYDYGSMDKASERQPIPVIHLLFTGNTVRGHFELLSPSERALYLTIPTGKYKLMENCTSSRLISIASIHSTCFSTNGISPRSNTETTQIQQVPNFHGHRIDSILSYRVVCGTCGFTVKNEVGLKIHSKVHRNEMLDSTTPTTSSISEACFRDDLDLVEQFGILINRCKHAIPLIRIIHKSVCKLVCQELNSVIDHVVLKNDIFAWLRLWSFPFFVLNMISKGNHRQNFIRRNLIAFSQIHDIQGIFRGLNKLLTSITHRMVRKQPEDSLVKTVHRKASEGDIARILYSQEGIAEHSIETIQKSLAKHPEDDGSIEEIPFQHDFTDTSCEQVVNSVRHFPMSSSVGLDGLRPRHLKDLMSLTCGDFAVNLTKAIAKLMDVILRGKVTAKVLPIFYGATLTTLLKKNKYIRPIAVGLVWRRLAGKIACFDVKVGLSQSLQPIQNGFGVKGGAEAIIHATKALVKMKHHKPLVSVKFDFRNACNEMKRKYLLQEIKAESPSLFPMLQQAYRCPSNLYYGDIVISSQHGIQQGDPFASAAFCIVLKRLSHSLSSRFNTWFQDDGTIGDEFEVVMNDVKKVLEFFEVSGLSFNTSKCEVFFVNASADEQREMLSPLNELLPGIKLLDF